MTMYNREYVGKAFKLLSEGLTDPVDEIMTKVFHSPDWTAVWVRIDQEKYGTPPRTMSKHEVQVQLHAITEYWRNFNDILSRVQQACTSELRKTHNRWANVVSFTVDEKGKALNTIEPLLDVVSAPDSADGVRKLRHALRHIKSDEPETADATQSAIAPHGPTNAAVPHDYDRQADAFFKTLLENSYTAHASVTNFMSQVSKHRKNPDEIDKATALADELAQLKSNRSTGISTTPACTSCSRPTTSPRYPASKISRRCGPSRICVPSNPRKSPRPRAGTPCRTISIPANSAKNSFPTTAPCSRRYIPTNWGYTPPIRRTAMPGANCRE